MSSSFYHSLNTPHTHLTHVHNTPSTVVGRGGGGAVVVSPITSATDRPRMKRRSMNIHNRDKGEVARTGRVSPTGYCQCGTMYME